MLLGFWRSLQPVHEAHRGALWAALCAGFIAVIIGGRTLHSGFGFWVDLAVMFVAVVIGLPVIALAIALLLTLLRKIPRLGTGVAVAVILLLALPWLNSWGYLLGTFVLVVECTLGASLATLLFGGLRYAALGRKTLTLGAGGLALFANVWLFLFLRSDGMDGPQLPAPDRANLPPTLSAPDPSCPGPYAVDRLFYGHGDDLRRSEYAKEVTLRTPTVDASPFFPEFGGWKARLRKLYWGFGMDRLPLNARVWYPRGAGPFPLVLMVHGNHEMSEFSDPGYAYLGELLASRGFIFVSIDENFLNVGLLHEPPEEQPVRAWLMLEHLKLWEQWNSDKSNAFHGKIDAANVALIGHSRGGAAAGKAALFDKLAYDPDNAAIRFNYHYPIKSVVAIAPTGTSESLSDVNYLTIQGAHDADVASFQGSEQWDHVRFTGDANYFKSELYIYGANHGQFNTVWGRRDARGPKSWFLNTRPLLSGDDQRQIAKVYIAAFLEATLHARKEYRQMLRDVRQARAWLPQTEYFDRYSDSSQQTIADFSEDSDLTTTTLPGGRLDGQNLTEWHEGRIPFRVGERGSNGVFLGWNNASASYALNLPRPGLTDQNSILMLSIAVTADDCTDFTIAVESENAVEVRLPVSHYRSLLPARPVRFTKIEYLDQILYKEPTEPVFQGVEIPLRDFAKADAHFDARRVRQVRLIFDRTPASEVLISQIGLARDPQK